MNQPAALRPLDAAADALRRLDGHDGTPEAARAIRLVVAAIEDSLRIAAGADPDTPLDEIVKSLRTRSLISLEAAGTVHEARAAGDRALSGGVREGDAARVRAAAERLRAELGGAAASRDEPGPAEPSGEKEPVVASRDSRWIRWFAAAVAAALLGGAVWVGIRGSGAEFEDAVVAFRAGRTDSAAAGFERVLADRPRDVTAMLYLARSYRRLGRPEQAADVLRRAVELDPADGDVRRELGHLFMDLGTRASAVAQYERAVESDPEEPLNWAALMQALRGVDDARAEQLLRDAPAEVRSAIGG